MSKKIDMKKQIEMLRRLGINELAEDIERLGSSEQPGTWNTGTNYPAYEKTLSDGTPDASELRVQKRDWAREKMKKEKSNESELETLRRKCKSYEKEIGNLKAELESERGFANHLMEKDLKRKSSFSRGSYQYPSEPSYHGPLFSEPPGVPKDEIRPLDQMLSCVGNSNIPNAIALRYRGDIQEGRCMYRATGRYLMSNDGNIFDVNMIYCTRECDFRRGIG